MHPARQMQNCKSTKYFINPFVNTTSIHHYPIYPSSQTSLTLFKLPFLGTIIEVECTLCSTCLWTSRDRGMSSWVAYLDPADVYTVNMVEIDSHPRLINDRMVIVNKGQFWAGERKQGGGSIGSILCSMGGVNKAIYRVRRLLPTPRRKCDRLYAQGNKA